MSSFNFNRNVNNKVIKKNVNFTTTPKINNNAFTLNNSNLNLSALTLNGNTITSSGDQLNYIDDATIGSATANKVVMPNNNLDISNINTITCNSLIVNGNNIIPSNSNGSTSESNSPYLQKIIPGKIQNSKAIVTDNNRNIETINKLSLNKLNISDNKILTSSNSVIKKKIYPLNWEVNPTTFSNNITSLCWSEELGLAVAVTSTGTGNQVLTSPDGITWTSRSTPVDRNWSSVCWAPEIGKFVAVASSPYTEYGGMTSNNSNGFVATSSSNLTNWDPWRAFDYSISTGWHTTESPTKYAATTGVYTGTTTITDTTSTVHSGEWIQLQASLAFLLTTFTITPRQTFGDQRSPRSFVILGSNNGSTWNLLFTETNKNDWPANNGSAVTFNITNPTTSYSYYRMVIKRVGNLDSGMSTASSVQIMNIEYNPEPFFSNVMYSSNGIDWTEVNPNISSNWTSVCWSPTLSLFTAVGTTRANRVMTSPDGINWTARTAVNLNAWQSICWSPQLSLFVAVSNTGTSNRVMTSVDGITWIGRSSSVDNNWSSIYWAPNINLLVAVSTSGSSNRIVTSPDSITWTTRLSPIDNNWLSVIYSKELNLLVAVASSGTNRIMFSENGTEWYISSYASSLNLNSIVWAPSIQKFIVVSSISPTESSILTSQTFNENLTLINPGKSYYNMVNGSTKFINKVVGNTFDTIPYASIWVKELNTFILGGGLGYIMLSSDGNVWTRYFTELTTIIQSIAWSPQLNLLVAVSPSTTNNILTSTDGKHWMLIANSTGNSTTWQSVCWSPELSLFVAVGNGTTNQRVITSPDGINWTLRTGVTNTWTAVCWSSELGLFVAIGNTNNTTNIMYSSDGINWTARTSISGTGSSMAFTSICWSPELSLFVAVSSDRVLISKDGSNWNYRSVNNNSWQSICWAKGLGLFLAVGISNNDTLMISADGNNWKTITTTDGSSGCRTICWSEELNTFVASNNNKIVTLNNFQYNEFSINSNHNLTNLSKYNNDNENNLYDTWYNTHSGINNEWTSICYSTDLALLAAVSKTGSGNRVMTSSNGTTWTSRTTPVSNTSSTPILSMNSIEASNGASFIILNDNTVKALGDNTYGLLGNGNTTNQNYPIALTGLSNVVKISSGSYFTLFLLSNGTIKSAGHNYKGQLGNGTTTNSSTPVNVLGIDNAIDISCGPEHAFALLSDGTVKAWGIDEWRLGIDENYRSYVSTPTLIPNITNAISIHATSNGGMALLSNGTIKSWGKENGSGQIGDGTTIVRKTPVLVSGINNAVAIASGNGHGLALLSDGTLKAWGGNYNGAVGIGTNGPGSDVLSPVTISGLSNIVAITAGGETSFVLLSDGTIKGWGANDYGQLGDGTTIKKNAPITIPGISNCIAIKNEYHTLALLSDGTLKAWGANHNRQLGNGLTNNTQLTPTTVLTSAINNNPLSNIKINATISTSDNNWTSICWSSELDLFVAVASSGSGNRVMTSPNGITWTSRSSAADNNWTSVCWSPELNLFVAVASSGSGNRVMTSPDGITWTSRSSAADNNWTSVCWSPELSLLVAVSNTGTGNRVMTSSNGITWTSRTSAANNDWTSVCWSYYYGLFVAVASSGTDNRIMISSNGINWSTSITYKPNQITSISMNSISACNNTSFAIISDNTMRAWGDNSNTKLGSTGSTSHTLPFLPGSIKTASNYWNNTIKVLANNNITVALLSNGNIQTRGLNTNGELGIANSIGTKGNSYTDVVDVTSITNATDIAIGEMHVLALLSDGTIKAWGTNTNGQLGDGSNTLRETPVTISSLSNVVAISTKNGGYHSLALLSDGTVKSWGLNTNGQLGNNSTNSQNIPVTVNNLSNIIAISAGANHSLALLNNGTIMAWGLNTSGQLGDGSTTQRNQPVLVSGITTAVAISAGYTHSLALLSDGTIRAWGSNNNGQLGDTTNNNSLTPVSVSSISTAVAISAGNEYSLALLSNSRLMSWGYNNVGQLGINSTTSRNIPGFVQFDATSTNILHSIKLNILNTTSYANNNWTSICWSDEMKVFVAIANSGSNRIMISNNGTTWYNKTLSVNNNWTSICWSDLLSRFIGVSIDSTNNILYSNIGINSLLSTVPTIINRQIGFYNNSLTIGGISVQKLLSINADSNNNILRLTNNKSATNCIDFNANGSTTHQLNIVNNSSNKIINIVNHNGSTFGLRFNDSVLPVMATDLNKLDATPGTASASKALITDSSGNITNINNISVNKLIVNNNLILNSSDNNNSYLSSITPGTVSPSKLMVLDSNRNISTLNKITTNNIKINKVNSIEHQLNKDNYDLQNYYFGQTKNSMLNPSNINMNSIVWSPELGIFVGVGITWQGAGSNKTTNNYSINYSYDGINWQAATGFYNSDRKLYIAWSSTLLRFVVVSDYLRVGYSLDGKNWTDYNISLTNSWTSLVWADTLNLFVAVSNTGTANRVMTSPDGITWSSRTSAADNNWTSLVWGNNTLVAVANSGTTNRVMTSTNGINWTSRTTPNSNDWNAITYGNGLFVAVSSTGTGNRVMTSPDGTTWTARTSVADNNWQCIIYVNSLFIVGSNSGTNNRIMTSSDGINWTTQDTTNLNIDFKCFAYSPSLNITVAGSNGNGLSNLYAYNKIATSTNGTSWTLRDSIYDLTWDVIYVNELSLFIGISSRGSNYTKQLTYSSDGYIWNYGYIDSTISASFKKVCWSPTLSLLIATSNTNNFYKSTNGINWTAVLVPSSTWNCILWINELSMFIAVGTSGQVTKSTDGDNWSSITMPSNQNNTYIAWSSSLNLAIITTQSNPTIYFTSNDGNTWTQRTMLADGINNINTNIASVITWISQLNLFMYFGISDNYTYYTSTDGLNWTTRTTQVTTSRSANLGFYNITRPPIWINKFNKLYAIHAGDTFSRIFESSDGITWNKYYVVNSLHDRYNSLCWADQIETLIAYGDNTYLAPVQPFMTLNTFNTPNINHNLSSINSLVNSYSNSAAIESISTWISRTSVNNNNWTSICYSFDKNLFVAVSNTGSGNRVMNSPNGGITWYSYSSASNNNWTSICYSNELGLFVAVANSGTGNRVMTSPDGSSPWTSRTSAADNNWTSICWSTDLGLFAAVASSGTGNRIMTSSNGTNWELRSNPTDNNWTSICWSSDLEIFVAVASSGTGNRVMTSYNGITWTSRTSAADNNWTSICWSLKLGLFVAVANTGTGDRVMTSPDGITWTSRTSATDNNWTSVCWAPEINSFIAIASSGTSNRIMTSFDGITWTSRTSPIDNDWTSICWSSGYNMAVAVSSTGTSTNRVLTSTISLPYLKSSYITAPGTLYINQINGRVGLGTVSPNYQLELSTDSAAKPSTSYWSVSSDMRLKEDIEDANLDICYDNIKKLRLVKYTWKNEIINPNSINESEEQNTQLGWIANEVEEIFPKAVKTVSAYNFDDCKSLDSDQIIASLFGAAKKLLNEYEEQKNIIQSLNSELYTLQNYINQLDISLE